MYRAEADFAPTAIQQVRSVLWAFHPKSQRPCGVDVGRRVEDVLAGGPTGVTAVGVEARDPLEERAAVGRVVAEVALLRHRLRMLVGRSRQGRGDAKRWKTETTAG